MCFHSVPVAHGANALKVDRFLAVRLEHLEILKFLPFCIFPFSFFYSKKPTLKPKVPIHP